MSLEEAVASHLQAQGVGVIGQDIFAGFMPERVKQGILILTPLQGIPIDFELPGYRRGSFQVVVRDTERQRCLTKANEVSNALNMDETTIDTVLFRYVRAKHDPVVYPMSKGNLLEGSVNFETVYILT